MFNILTRAHSGLRWVVLGLLVYAIVNALMKKGKGEYVKKDKLINLFAMISLHTQLLIGLILYFISPKVNFSQAFIKSPVAAQFRFFSLEHLIGMLLAIVLVTIGRKKAENASNTNQKHQQILVYYSIALILIFASIPWPFRNLGVTSWF